MAETKLANVTVDELSKFGFKSNGEYINWSKTLKDDAKVNVVPGRSFRVELYIANSGKKYVNKVLSQLDTLSTGDATPKAVTPKVTKNVTFKPVPTAPNGGLSKDEWAAKDVRISRQGVIQAAVRAVSSYSTMEDIIGNATELANAMLDYVNQK